MELEKNQFTIVVACHQEAKFPSLSSPYREVCVYQGESKPLGYDHYVSRVKNRLIYPDAWSEIEVFLDLRSFTEESEVVGLHHYRRFFAFGEEHSEEVVSMPFSDRSEFADAQVGLQSRYIDAIVIPKKWEFSYSAWNQFLVYKPELEEIFTFSLSELDSLLHPYFGKVNSKEILQESSYLYPLNMFVGRIEFFEEWHGILSNLVARIESAAPQFGDALTPRWGGFLAERFFSVYITLCQENRRWKFVEKSVVFFNLEEENNEHQELTQQHQELTQQHQELTQQRDELTQQRDELTQQRDELVNSTIWRATKSLRSSINFFKK